MSRRRAGSPQPIEDTQADADTMPPRQPPPNQASAAQKPRRELSPCLSFAFEKLKALRPVCKSPDLQYLPLSGWQSPKDNLRVRCGQLRPDTGESTTGRSFLRLMSPENTKRLLQPLKDSCDEVTMKFNNHYLTYSECTISLLESCIWAHYKRPMIYEHARWFPEHLPGPDQAMLTHDWDVSKKVRWIVPPWVFKPAADGSQANHASYPHINCFLLQHHQLKEDMLLMSEVWCLLVLSLTAHNRSSQGTRKIVPITMISIADGHARIVQGYVDGKAQELVLNKTPILSLEKRPGQEDAAWGEVVRILRWALGTPIPV